VYQKTPVKDDNITMDRKETGVVVDHGTEVTAFMIIVCRGSRSTLLAWEATCFSKFLEAVYKTVLHHIPRDLNPVSRNMFSLLSLFKKQK
jgi:hypothetical protein